MTIEYVPRFADAVTRQAEIGVGDRDGALRLWNSRECAAGGDVLCDEASSQHDGERARSRGDTKREQHGTAGPVPQTRPREPERKPDRADRLHSSKRCQRASITTTESSCG